MTMKAKGPILPPQLFIINFMKLFSLKRFSFVLIILLVSSFSVWAASGEYIYRQRVNWVKLSEANQKDLPPGELTHPYTSITVEQMEAMLLSVKISQKYVLKKEVDTSDVFSTWEAHKYAPMIVEALAKATPDQVVNFSIVHKRPFFILRNDRLSMANVFVASDGLHIQFSKIFAQLSGDYEASAHMEKALRDAKTLRVSLAAQAGQVLSYTSPTELILDPNYDFVAHVQKEQNEQEASDEQEMKGAEKKEKKSATKKEETSVASVPSEGESATDRLKQLEDLKRQKLITDQEYTTLRQKILSDL